MKISKQHSFWPFINTLRAKVLVDTFRFLDMLLALGKLGTCSSCLHRQSSTRFQSNPPHAITPGVHVEAPFIVLARCACSPLVFWET
jgi:hypothetical protein